LECTGTGQQNKSRSARAAVPRTLNAGLPTENPTGNFMYVAAYNQYINVNHPWTTGYAIVHNPLGSPDFIIPRWNGYDKDIQGQNIQITRFDWNETLNETLNTITTTTANSVVDLRGVGRIVSLVRPRLIHTYANPIDRSGEPLKNVWNVARIARMRVFFVPEPTAMLMLGAGIAGMLGLSRIRRR
jgi:hypothetical protein